MNKIINSVRGLIGAYYSVTEGINASKYEDVLSAYKYGEIAPETLLKRIAKLLQKDKLIKKIATGRYIPTKSEYDTIVYHLNKLQREIRY